MTANAKSQPQMQSRQVGVWIDHASASIVGLCGDEVACIEVHSNVGSKHRTTGGTRMPGRSFVKSFSASERHNDRVRREHLRRFYVEVIEKLKGAERVLLLGPGVAKLELAKELKKDASLAASLAEVRTADDLTPRQLIAEVKHYFA